MAEYMLPAHVFLCASGDHIVLLDLRRDRYFALDLARARLFATLVEGWPDILPVDRCSVHGSCEDVPSAEHLASQLHAKGLLTSDSRIGKRAALARIATPTSDLLPEAYSPGRLASPLWEILGATLTATYSALLRRFARLEYTVFRVRHRRERRGSSNEDFDVGEARLVAILFEQLRPFMFTTRDSCLFESLLFLELCAHRRLYPYWVFGVQTLPFSAHCWVQQGSVVLNDSVERVRRFNPIMVV